MKDGTQNSLTDTERRYIAQSEAPPPDSPDDLRGLRSIMSTTAFHEAGHVAAVAFAGFGSEESVRVSIMPDNGSGGFGAACAGSIDAMKLVLEYGLLSQEELIPTGFRFLLMLMAGDVAHGHLAPDYRSDGDQLMAEETADIMARHGVPVQESLERAKRMTVEMLELPDVWQLVEHVASELLKRGSIENDQELCSLMSELTPLTDRPGWQERLAVRVPPA